MTIPPSMPLQPFIPLPIPAQPPFQQTKKEAEAILLAGAEAPLPLAVRRHQQKVLTRVRDVLASTGAEGHRLYVLEIAGPIPRIKIGRSSDPRARIREHVHEMNSYQYGLIDAHVTDPVDDLLSITRAENEAHIGMGKRYERINRELFRDADFLYATLWADLAVTVQLNRLYEDTDPASYF
ncbi:GIY-YIG nuclease family protein [Streptomyces hirsutus]|uniref:GIY-YIG nuclease family protein n=1 Tax=Streptomyces hirsutus TaxID=35620 RepID=UPI00332BEAC5